jgi:amino acid adenylation domain-containing protein
MMPESGSRRSLLARILAPGGDQRTALCAGGRTVSYRQLRSDVQSVREQLAGNGIGQGDRVAVCLPKTVSTVETILGILATKAAYVPLNHRLSEAHLLRILADLQPHLVIATGALAAVLRKAAGDAEPPFDFRLAVLADEGSIALEFLDPLGAARVSAPSSPPDLAVILYTSGTTGEPKGIMLTHANVASFVDWAADTFVISSSDRLANHAPLHFDLSIFDIFCGLTRHASVHLIDETIIGFPGAIRWLIGDAGITVWYSVPTALVRLQERAALKDLPSLRLILFAGEVFPVPSLRRLMADVPAPDVNLYGPTETNVATYFRLPGPPVSDFEQVPTGWPCEHLDVRLLDPAGAAVQAGEIGEICVAGGAVMAGYWGRPEATQAARLQGRPDSYRTGDHAYVRGDGALMFVGGAISRSRSAIIASSSSHLRPRSTDIRRSAKRPRCLSRSLGAAAFLPRSWCRGAPDWTRRRSAPFSRNGCRRNISRIISNGCLNYRRPRMANATAPACCRPCGSQSKLEEHR